MALESVLRRLWVLLEFEIGDPLQRRVELRFFHGPATHIGPVVVAGLGALGACSLAAGRLGTSCALSVRAPEPQPSRPSAGDEYALRG